MHFKTRSMCDIYVTVFLKSNMAIHSDLIRSEFESPFPTKQPRQLSKLQFDSSALRAVFDFFPQTFLLHAPDVPKITLT